MSMGILVIDEAKIEYPDKCPDCGDVPGRPEIVHEVTSFWNRGDRPCSFCGKAVKIASGVWQHYDAFRGKALDSDARATEEQMDALVKEYVEAGWSEDAVAQKR